MLITDEMADTRLNQDWHNLGSSNAGCVNYHQDDPYQDWHTPGGVITCWIPTTDTNYKSDLNIINSHNKISQGGINFTQKRLQINH